jgi:hypothetical protein
VIRVVASDQVRSGVEFSRRSVCTTAVATELASERGAVVPLTKGPLRTALCMTTLNSNNSADPRDASDDSAAWPTHPISDDCPHEAYSEEAFRYFLGLERKRAERSGRPLLLLLVNVSSGNAGSAITPIVAAKIFGGLSLCIRDVDFVGWYRHGRVAGAVLTQGTDSPALRASEQIGQRVAELLGKQLPASIAARLQVRVLQPRQADLIPS